MGKSQFTKPLEVDAVVQFPAKSPSLSTLAKPNKAITTKRVNREYLYELLEKALRQDTLSVDRRLRDGWMVS